MTSERKFYKTVIKVVVLSEEPYEPYSLSSIAEDMLVGDCSGAWEVESSKQVDARTMAALLQEQGLETNFFQLDEDGNSITVDDNTW